MSGLSKEICQDCGKVFLCRGYGFYCETCRKKRVSEAAKKAGLNKLGNEARKKKSSEKEHI